MNSEYSTPARSQQHSPVPLTNQQLASVCADIQLATPAVYGLAPLDLPPSAVDVSHAHLAYLKNAYPGRPYSPSTMDFAGMNIATGYPTPHSATPVGMQSQAAHPQVSLEGTAVGAAAPAAASQTPSAEKPDFSYASLIAQSLVDAPMQRRTLNGIYEWIQEHFPYYRTRQNWQNSIRHNLSLNKGFMKIKRDEAHPGKGSFWTFTPGYESCLNGGHFKPIRSRSGRAALAAAAAMAAAKSSTGSPSANDLAADANSDSEARLPGQEEKSAKKGEKKTVRAIKSAKSLKRSHSVPPKDHSAPLPQGASDADAAAAAAAVTAGEAAFAMSMACVSDAMFPGPLMHCETAPAGLMTGRNATKKMRVSSSQSHMNIASMSAVTPGGASMMSYPQTPSFVPSPAPYMASPALMSATPMSVVSTAAHTPLNQPAQFQFHMPSPCSMPLPISAMDMASVPANNAGGPYGIGSAFMGPHTAHLGEAAHAGIDGTPMFGDAVSTSDPLYATRRSNMHPRISWHGSESMNQAFAGLQHPGQQCHPNSLGVTMGPESMDIGLTMLGDGHGGMCMAGDGAVNTTPVDWAMFAGMSAPHPIQTDMSMNTPQLHHMSSISTIDASSSGPQSQQRPAGTSGIDAAATTSAGSASGPGIMALYDEVLRDSSSLMNVFGQDLSGWQCPTKTNTIDPAALCAVDPDTSSL